MVDFIHLFLEELVGMLIALAHDQVLLGSGFDLQLVVRLLS